MDASEIKDEKSLKAWLESLPARIGEDEAQRWAVRIAHRAAMRVLPAYWRSPHDANMNGRRLTAIPILRLNLIGGVASIYPTPRMRRAADSALTARTADKPFSILSFRRSTLGAANSDLSAADVARTARTPLSILAYGTATFIGSGTAWTADAAALEAGADLFALPLWPTENPFVTDWSEIRNALSDQSPDWRFWTNWYDNALNGNPQDWDLLTKIALIDPDDWEKPEAEVNALIAKIVHDHRSQAPKPPDPPQFTDVERSHIQLVLATPTASRRSAEFLRVQFETMEAAYRRREGCLNETPPELEPIVTLAKTFGKIAQLLAETSDKDLLIVRLEEQISVLQQQNAALMASANGPKASLMREVFAGCLGSATGALLATVITTNFSFFGGPAVAEGAEALSNIIEPLEPGPVIPIWPSIPRD